jgi:hypothetical protein
MPVVFVAGIERSEQQEQKIDRFLIDGFEVDRPAQTDEHAEQGSDPIQRGVRQSDAAANTG